MPNPPGVPGTPPARGRTGRGISVLIDLDSVPAHDLYVYMDAARSLGPVCAARAFGSAALLHMWGGCLEHMGITPVHSYAGGENAADATLIIDAIDQLHDGVDSFFLVGGDHIYAGLVRRLRGWGAFVGGTGRRPAHTLRKALGGAYVQRGPRSYTRGERFLAALLLEHVHGDETVSIDRLHDRMPNFVTKQYCHARLTTLIRSLPDYLELVPCGRDGVFLVRRAGRRRAWRAPDRPGARAVTARPP